MAKSLTNNGNAPKPGKVYRDKKTGEYYEYARGKKPGSVLKDENDRPIKLKVMVD